jgi:hypothetical protein
VIQIRNLPVSFGDSISFLSMVQGYALDRRLGTAELRSAGQVGHPSTRSRPALPLCESWKEKGRDFCRGLSRLPSFARPDGRDARLSIVFG